MKSLNKTIRTIFAVIIISSCFFCVYSTNIQEEDNLLVLINSNFEHALHLHKLILVEFYTTWCVHCKALEPEFAKAARILKEKNSEFRLAKVDVTNEKEISKRFFIESFPTLLLFKEGKETEYNGIRKAEAIVSWLENKLGLAIKHLESKQQLDNFIESSQVVVVFFGTENDNHYIYFREVSENEGKFPYAVISDESVFAEHGVQANDIVLFKHFDEKKAVYDRTSRTDSNTVSDFIRDYSMPLVNSLHQEIAELLFGHRKTSMFLYRDQKDSHLDELLKEVAHEYQGKIYFVACGITEGLEVRLAQYIGITEADLPILKIQEDLEIGLRKFTLKKPISKDNVREFLSNYTSNKLKAEYKSDEIPETQDLNSSVIKIVGKNWNNIVLDRTKDVLVEFYVPWSGNCKALAPKLENLAQKVSGYKNLVIAKMDATANEVEGEEVDYYPTLRFYSHSDKAAEVVDGRNENDILEFLKSKDLVDEIDDVVFESPVEADSQEDHDHRHEHEHEYSKDIGDSDDGDLGGEEEGELKNDL